MTKKNDDFLSVDERLEAQSQAYHFVNDLMHRIEKASEKGDWRLYYKLEVYRQMRRCFPDID